jgi:phosphoglycolate phosphatase
MKSSELARAYVFDYDDTLVRTRQCRFAAIKTLAERHYSHTLTDQDINAHWGKPFFELFQALFNSVASDTKEVINRYLSLIDEFPILAHTGATEALKALSAKYFVGVVTSAHSRIVKPELERLGFPIEEIKHIQCADDTDFHKPDPRVFDPLIKVLTLHGIDKSEVIYVGDAITDHSAALAAGLSFIGFYADPDINNPFTGLNIRVVSDLRRLS